MSYKKQILILLTVFIVIFIVGFELASPRDIGLCAKNDSVCNYEFGASYGLPIWFLSLAIILTLIVLLFSPERAYHAWKKFALVSIPLGAIWIATTPVSCGGGFGLSLCFNKEAITWLTSGLFLGISLIIILVSSLRKKNP